MDQDWKSSLAARNNVMYCDIPHIPILVQDIPSYISQDDYEQNRVKKIQTVGTLIYKGNASGELISLDPANKISFPVSFENLDFAETHVKISDGENIFCPIWEKHKVFKIFGTLMKKEGGHVLETYRLVPVEDVEGTYKLISTLAKLARSEYRRYYRTPAQYSALRSQFEEMERERKLHKRE